MNATLRFLKQVQYNIFFKKSRFKNVTEDSDFSITIVY